LKTAFDFQIYNWDPRVEHTDRERKNASCERNKRHNVVANIYTGRTSLSQA
jgi:hypothetical protein